MEPGKLIFQNENKQHWKCLIYDCGDRYELRAANETAIFDKNKAVLQSVIRAIKEYGNPQAYRKRKMGFVFRHKESGARTYEHVYGLARVVFAAYYKKDVEEYAGRRLFYIDGDEFNLRKSNMRTASLSSVDIFILSGKEYIRIRDKGNSTFAITNYNEQLYNIISGVSWGYDQKTKAFKHAIFKGRKYYLHQLIWVFFKCGATNSDWKNKIFSLYEENPGYTIDHKRSGRSRQPRWDNRIENLQLIAKLENSRKSNCTLKIKSEDFYIPTLAGEVYGKYNNNSGDISAYISNGKPTETSITNLIHFCKSGSFADGAVTQTFQQGSIEAFNIVLADLHETKLYMLAHNL